MQRALRLNSNLIGEDAHRSIIRKAASVSECEYKGAEPGVDVEELLRMLLCLTHFIFLI